jgi:hypothetical protein
VTNLVSQLHTEHRAKELKLREQLRSGETIRSLRLIWKPIPERLVDNAISQVRIVPDGVNEEFDRSSGLNQIIALDQICCPGRSKRMLPNNGVTERKPDDL